MSDTTLSLDISMSQEPFPNIESKKTTITPTSIIKNSQSKSSASKSARNSENGMSKGRKRSNSQSQVVATPPIPTINASSNSASSRHGNHHYGRNHQTQAQSKNQLLTRKRNQAQYFVTLLPLNDTFIKKQLPVATYPETTKLGRPTGTKHKPDVTNGYFDSRVLSRNHAQIYIEPSTGKLMLQDLGSSNGTYLNDVRLGTDPVEIQIGDIVCLGFNVQAESTHKQISLKIENINVISNSGVESALFGPIEELDPSKYKHLAFVDDIYRQILETEGSETKGELKVSTNLATPNFDSALFGDINPNFEDNLLGLYSQTNSGIYNNSQITNSTALENVISVLVVNLSRVKQQNASLTTLDKFFSHYRSQLNDMNRKFLDQEFKTHLTSLQDELKRQQVVYESLVQRSQTQQIDSQEKIVSLKQEILNYENKLDVLEEVVEGYKQQENEHMAMYEKSLLRIQLLEHERDALQATLLEMKKSHELQQQQHEQEKLEWEAKEKQQVQAQEEEYLNGSKGYESKEATLELLDHDEGSTHGSSTHGSISPTERNIPNEGYLIETHLHEVEQSSPEEIVPHMHSEVSIEDVSHAINGFILDLSRTPSVRDSGHAGSRKGSIELTPPVSDSEEDDTPADPEIKSPEAGFVQIPLTPEHEHQRIENEPEAILRRRVQSGVNITCPQQNNTKEVEPFPTVNERNEGATMMDSSSIKTKLFNHDNAQKAQVVAYVMSGFVMGYFIQRIAGQ